RPRQRHRVNSGTATVLESVVFAPGWRPCAPRRESRRASGFRFGVTGFGATATSGAGGGAGPSTTASVTGGGSSAGCGAATGGGNGTISTPTGGLRTGGAGAAAATRGGRIRRT